jgi:nucleoside-diphosphate-sugar epimerase
MVNTKDIRVIVTGATGFVGRHVINVLQKQSIPYIAIGQNTYSELSSERENFVVINLLSPDAPEKLATLGGTHLIHLAWFTDHNIYWSSSKNFEWVSASLSLVRAFVSSGRHVTAIGTCAEYDWSRGLCIENCSPLEPSTIYGQTKASTSRLIQAVCTASGVSCCWARLFIPFGLGEHPDRLIPSVADAFSEIRPKFPVGNENWRDFLAIEDIADAIVYLTLVQYEGEINICSGIPRQINEVVAEIGRLLGVANGTFPDAKEKKKNNPRWILGDDSRLRDSGWRPRKNFSERLAFYLGQRKITQQMKKG